MFFLRVCFKISLTTEGKLYIGPMRFLGYLYLCFGMGTGYFLQLPHFSNTEYLFATFAALI